MLKIELPNGTATTEDGGLWNYRDEWAVGISTSVHGMHLGWHIIHIISDTERAIHHHTFLSLEDAFGAIDYAIEHLPEELEKL